MQHFCQVFNTHSSGRILQSRKLPEGCLLVSVPIQHSLQVVCQQDFVHSGSSAQVQKLEPVSMQCIQHVMAKLAACMTKQAQSSMFERKASTLTFRCHTHISPQQPLQQLGARPWHMMPARHPEGTDSTLWSCPRADIHCVTALAGTSGPSNQPSYGGWGNSSSCCW